MTVEERVQAVGALGFTERQARFLVMVALHSGYCLRRQYETFAGIRYGKNVRAFLDGLVSRGLADRAVVRADRGLIYHLRGRAIYEAIGEGDNRNRRPASAAQMARKVMLLDVVIGRPRARWFTTERDKLNLLVNQCGVPARVLLGRSVGQPADDEATVRCFTRKLPIFLTQDDSVPHFVYLALDGSMDAFGGFLRDHARLLRWLPKWVVVAVVLAQWPRLQTTFDRFIQSWMAALPPTEDELPWYFERRRLVEHGDLAQVSVGDLRRYREMRKRFDSPAHELLYGDWVSTGRVGGHTPGSPTGDSIGRLLVEVLPFAYEQFGSLPGVA
jgi:hypothetical protein